MSVSGKQFATMFRFSDDGSDKDARRVARMRERNELRAMKLHNAKERIMGVSTCL